MTQLLYLECTSGISGDMAAAALLDLGADEAAVRRAMESLPVEGFSIEVTRVVKSGLDVCDFNVVLDDAHENHDHDMAYLHGAAADARAEEHGHGHDHDHGHGRGRGDGHSHGHTHHHRGPADIEALIDGADMTPGAKALARSMFGYVARAEARAHGVPLSEVHFHEVGAVDSIADIVAIAVAADSLGVDGVVVGDLPCGRGTVRCQHGVIPVPAPATVFIAEEAGLVLAPSEVEGELVTPTGAAVAAALRTQTALPERFTVQRIGMGAGKRAYDTPGILRALLIEPQE
ncbi:nickel insertion protein [uncultured Adlercreutzia sp.]|uniref:nickel insertion protein n=1 Tax=uncultured Adlercreutzia sp. TaxID=875803 RepID=UPI0026F3B78D|nr:nickel insertion protein [uncultured Adlercreutzia sp.]